MTDTEAMLREQATMPRRVDGCMVAHTSCGCFTPALDALIAYVRAEARVEALRHVAMVAWHPKDGRDELAAAEAELDALKEAK